MTSFGCVPFAMRVPVRAVGRRDHVALLERAADADRDGLLADRDVQEPGQLAGAEALLDLLLEPADEQHLPKEVLQALARTLPAPFPRGLPRRRQASRASAIQWRPDGTRRTSRRDRPRAPARLGARAPRAHRRGGGRRRPRGADPRARHPGPRGRIVHAPVARRHHGPGTRRPSRRRVLARLDEAGIRAGCGSPSASGRPEGRRSCRGRAGGEAHDAGGILGRARAAAAARLERPLRARSSSTRATTSTAARCCSRPINPARAGRRPPSFRFRAARLQGYGVAPVMARRAFERLDDERHHRRLSHPARPLRHERAASRRGPSGARTGAPCDDGARAAGLLEGDRARRGRGRRRRRRDRTRGRDRRRPRGRHLQRARRQARHAATRSASSRPSTWPGSGRSGCRST